MEEQNQFPAFNSTWWSIIAKPGWKPDFFGGFDDLKVKQYTFISVLTWDDTGKREIYSSQGVMKRDYSRGSTLWGGMGNIGVCNSTITKITSVMVRRAVVMVPWCQFYTMRIRRTKPKLLSAGCVYIVEELLPAWLHCLLPWFKSVSVPHLRIGREIWMRCIGAIVRRSETYPAVVTRTMLPLSRVPVMHTAQNFFWT